MPAHSRQPAIYIPHGGGPWPFVELPFIPPGSMAPLERYLRALMTSLPRKPQAVLVVSAHWEEAVPTLMTSPRPPMLYDYYGFPQAAYELQWPAPGAVFLAERANALLQQAGFQTAEDPARGYDHGTFVPLMLAMPEADIPILQVSMLRSMDPAEHVALGRALAPLREENVLLIGSGNSYHNMRGFGRPESTQPSRQFDDWMVNAVTQSAEVRERLLVEWEKAPAARQCHPREEHLLPLHVMAGAAGTDAAIVPLRLDAMRVYCSAVQFG